jgi:hypothetical protein
LRIISHLSVLDSVSISQKPLRNGGIKCGESASEFEALTVAKFNAIRWKLNFILLWSLENNNRMELAFLWSSRLSESVNLRTFV